MPISDRMAEALKESYQGLEKIITERTRDLSMLYAALAPLASADSDQLLQQIVERLKEATGSDATLIRILDKETKSFLTPAHTGFPQSYLRATENLDKGSAVRESFMSGEPIITENIGRDLRLKGKRQMEAGFRSCAFLPLHVAGELRGVIHLASREIGHFSADKRDHLMTIARHMGVAMENRELLEATKRRAGEQEALNVIAKAISQSLERDELLKIALDKTMEITGRERGSIRLKDPLTGEIKLAAHRGLSREEIDGLARTVSRQATEQVFASGQPHVVNERPDADESQSLLPQSRSVAWIPIKAGTKITGVLCVSTTRPVPFLPHEVDLLQAVASMIGVSLENVQLYENERRQVSSLKLLVQASRKLIEQVDIQTVAEDILQTVVASFGIPLAWIGSAEPGGRVRPLYWAGDVAEYLRHVEIRWDDSPLGHGPAGRAIRTGMPVVMDVAADPGFAPWRDSALANGYREVAAFPLMRGPKPFGHLIMYSNECGFFTTARVELLQTYTNIATAAMENARMLDEAQREARERAALNSIATAVSRSLEVDEILNIAIDKVLEVTNRGRGYIRIQDPLTAEIGLAVHRGISEAYVEKLLLRRTPGGFTNQVFASGAPLIVNDAEKISLREETRREGHRVMASVPLKTRGKVVGTLNVSSTEPVPFSEREVELLQSVGNVVGVALENAWLYRETRRQQEIQTLLKELSQNLSVTGLEVLLTKIAEKVREIFRVEIADFRIIDKGASKYIGRSGEGAERLIASGKIRGRMRWLLEHRQPLMIPDTTVAANFPAGESISRLGIRGYLAVPLFSRNGEVLGALRALTRKPREFKKEQIELLQQLANGAAIAIENALLVEETRRRAQEQAALSAIATATSQSLHIDEVLRIALDKVLEVTGHERGYIRLRDPLTQEIKLAAHRGISEQYAKTLLHERSSGGKSDQVFKTGEPLIINDAQGALLKNETRQEGSSSIAWIPMKAQGKVVGILNVSTARPTPFTPREVDLFQSIGNVIGVAVENAWLYQESQRQQEIQKLLKELSQDITSLDIKSFFRKATDKVREFFKVDVSDIRLLEEGGMQSPAGSSGVEAERLYGRGGLRGRSGWIVKHRRPAVISDTQKETDIPAGETVRKLGIRGYLGVPLFSRQGEVIGILRAMTYAPREFSDFEVDLLQQLANGAAIAITNAKLFEETERRARELAALYAVTSAISGSFDIEDILLKGLDAVLAVSGMDGGYIRYLEGTPVKLALKVHRGMSKSFIAKTLGEIRPGGKTEQLIATKQPLVQENIPVDHKGKFAGEQITAGAWVPIVSKDKVIAILSISSKTKRNFPQARLPLLLSIGNALGVALENVRLFKETERNLERIRALREIDQAISSTLDLGNVLNILLEKIDLSLPYATATIRLINRESGILEPVACRNLDEAEWKAEQWKAGRGIANVVFETKSPLIIKNAQNDPRVIDTDFYRKHKLTSYVGVPLIVKEESLGVLGFYTKEEHEFSDEEVEFLSTLAGQAAIAIHNSQLYENTRLRENQLKETNRMLSGLHAVAAMASQSFDLDRVLNAAIEKITDIFGFDATQIHIYNDRTDELFLRAGFERDPNRFVTVQTFRLGQGIVGKVAESGSPLIFEDVQDDPVYRRLSRSQISGQSGYRLFAVFPIKGKLRNLGTLACTGVEPRRLNSGELQLIEAMADQIAVAIENGELYEQLRQKIEELQQANKVKDEFLSVMSHELRTPLNVVMGYTAMIKDEMLGSVNAEQRRALEKCISRSNDLLNMITSILYATSIEAKEVRVQNTEFSLPDLLDELKRTYEVSLNKAITLDWRQVSDFPPVILDRDKVRVVLQKIIDNATKFTEKGRVAISARFIRGHRDAGISSRSGSPPATGYSVELKVEDTGVGINREKLPIIFDKFRQADSSETRRFGGVGLGLYIAKHFTELMGGKIEVDTEEGKGSIFTVTVPCLISSPAAEQGRAAPADGLH